MRLWLHCFLTDRRCTKSKKYLFMISKLNSEVSGAWDICLHVTLWHCPTKNRWKGKLFFWEEGWTSTKSILSFPVFQWQQEGEVFLLLLLFHMSPATSTFWYVLIHLGSMHLDSHASDQEQQRNCTKPLHEFALVLHQHETGSLPASASCQQLTAISRRADYAYSGDATMMASLFQITLNKKSS